MVALIGLIQLFVCAVVPLTEARAPSKLGAHIERPTERTHYVHDETYCAACIARHLTGTAPLPAPIPTHATIFVAGAPRNQLLPPEAERRDPTAARAPPAPARLG
jgi:hypothetical protein